MKKNIENEVRLNSPKDAMAADYGGSRSIAIELFCESCMGGSRQEASRCKSFSCNLWPYRPNGNKTPAPAGTIPSKEELQKLIDKAGVNDKRVAHGKKLAAARWGKNE